MPRQIIISQWESFKYKEVWEIVERRNQSIYKIVFTGKYISIIDMDKLDKNYQAVTISINMNDVNENIVMKMWDFNEGN